MRVLRTENAEADLDSIADYFGALNPAATLAMLDAIAQMESILADNPLIGRTGRVAGSREAVVVGTPFILAYTASPETLTVLRVLHGNQQWPDDLASMEP